MTITYFFKSDEFIESLQSFYLIYNIFFFSNLIILARSENADKIPYFKFDNCSSFVKYQNAIFNKLTKQVVKVKNAERCWNISVSEFYIFYLDYNRVAEMME